MNLFVFLIVPLMMFVFGFFPIAMALRGKGDLVTALKFGIIPGIFGFVLTYFFFTFASTSIFGALSVVHPAIYALEVVGFILAMASAAFVAVGITGFTFKPEAAPITAHVVNFVGVLLVILGLFVAYWYTQLPFISMYVAALMVILFGVACLVAGYSVLGKMKGGGDIILGIVVINTILAFVLLFL
jgi:hypothetical protein